MAKKVAKITENLCKNALCIIDRGLSNGLRSKGKVCIEYAIAIASGQPEDRDGPTCVHPSLRSFKIGLNDELPFDNEQHRAKALRRIGIAQLGTDKGFSWKKFTTALHAYNKKFLADYLVAATPKVKPVPKSFQAIVVKALKTQIRANLEDAQNIINNLIEDAEERSESKVESPNSPNFISNLCYASNDVEPNFEAYIEGIVQILKKMKTPGSKFLYLTEGKKKFKLDAAIQASLDKITK